MKKILSALIVLCFIVSCSSTGTVYAHADFRNFVYEYKIEGNPTTGYTWVYEASGDGEVKIEEQISAHNEELVGSGSMYTYTISGVKPGLVNIRFLYIRPWEGEAIKEKVLSLSVNEDLSIEKVF